LSLVSVIASPATWIEGEAVRQLEQTAELPGVRQAIGLPDLHPGKGAPIGAAYVIDSRIYPHLVGSDVGCGMALVRTDLKRKKVHLDRWAESIVGLETPWDGDTAAWLAEDAVETTAHDAALGTIGGGNHFAELQAIERIDDRERFDALGLDRDRLVLMVHSGSRGLGESVLRAHTERFGAGGLAADSEEGTRYLARHDHAMAWASSSRRLIATRFLQSLGGDGERVIDICHNSVTRSVVGGAPCFLHRKGAAPSDQGPIVIPGSRGSMSHLVMPTGDLDSSARSLAHGAGRRWTRGGARERMRGRVRADTLRTTELGSRVICDDKDLLFEEAPQAYKSIDTVIEDLLDAGLISKVATLRPLITYKTRRA
jgi:release factor H-coupled RctB family protein